MVHFTHIPKPVPKLLSENYWPVRWQPLQTYWPWSLPRKLNMLERGQDKFFEYLWNTIKLSQNVKTDLCLFEHVEFNGVI